MDLELNGKTALVSGSTAGIGLAIAKALAAEGASVVIAGRTQNKLEAAEREVRAVARAGAIVTALELDLAIAAGSDAMIRKVPDVDILVNNLGIYEARAFEDITDAQWLHMFDVNVLSGVRLARHYFPRMLARNWGRVIFISSDYGAGTPGDMVDYGVTKSALQAVSRGMAERTKGTNVTVNSVLPGATHSDGIMAYLRAVVGKPGMTDKDVEATFFRTQRPSSLIQRMLDAGEIANMVAFLASPLSSATNGSAVRVEGGSYRSIL